MSCGTNEKPACPGASPCIENNVLGTDNRCHQHCGEFKSTCCAATVCKGIWTMDVTRTWNATRTRTCVWGKTGLLVLLEVTTSASLATVRMMKNLISPYVHVS